MGRQGSGKGTQAKFLSNEFHYPIIGSGDILRSFYEGTGFSARKAKEVMNKGVYVPTPLIFRLWMDKLEAIKDLNKEQGLIFDGSPRKILEAHLLDQALAWYEWDSDLRVFLIDISRDEAMNRLSKRRMCEKCGKLIPWVGAQKSLTFCDNCGGKLVSRPDDTPEGIKSRLDLFKAESVPVIEHYTKAGKLTVINGEQAIEEVYKELKSYL